jgi:type I restriction enzyme R subunit
MADLNLSTLTEADIITKRVMPAILDAGWNDTTQIRQEVKLRDGKVIVRGKVAARRTVKSADIVLYHKPGIPLAVIEAKANKHEIGKGMQQGIEYARLLDVPFVFATNGDGFIFRDATAAEGELLEKVLPWMSFHRQMNSGISSASGKATPQPASGDYPGLLRRRQRQSTALLPATGHQ